MSEFWVRKMKTYFHRFDLDKDGVIMQKDFEMMVERFGKTENADPDDSQTIRKLAIEVFLNFCASITAGVPKGDEVLTESAFVESMKIIRSSPEFEASLTRAVRLLFQIMNTNKDGLIQEEEHRRYFEGLGFTDTSFTKTAFQNIDTDGDGVLNFDEFAAACFEFIRSEDENNPHTLFFGTLISD